MGNDTTCSRLCEKKGSTDPAHDQFLNTQYIIPCQICNQQFKHQALKNHIDVHHFAALKEEADGRVSVQCLLCDKASSDLVQHGNHIKEKHRYAETKVNKGKANSQVVTQNTIEGRQIYEDELNKNKKKSVKKLSSQRQFQIISQIGSNHYEASVSGVKYEVHSFIKQYRGVQYQPSLAEAEVVWFNIFKEGRKCKYYYFDLQPGQRNILCKAYIFIAMNQ